MTNAEILNLIAERLADILELDSVELTPTSNANDFAEWDSINHVRLMISLETTLGIRFDSSEVGMIDNVGQLVELISRKKTSF